MVGCKILPFLPHQVAAIIEFFEGLQMLVLPGEVCSAPMGCAWCVSEVVSAIGHTFKILDEYSQQLAKGQHHV